MPKAQTASICGDLRRKRRYFRGTLRRWYKANARSYPWRTTRSPYEILVAEILLQQTDAPKVEAIYEEFLQTFPSPAELAEAPRRAVAKFIGRIGLDYRTGRLVRIARDLERKHGGEVPTDRDSLLRLPGVGPYIANAVLAGAFGQRYAVVDTNVVRVLDRFFAVRSQRPRPRTDPALWHFAHGLLPRRRAECRVWNYAILDFGGLVCRHHGPRCAECPCRRKCDYAIRRNC